MDITQMNQTDPKDQAVLQDILHKEPKSQIIFQQSYSPSGLQKGISIAPILLLIVGSIPIIFILIFFYTFFTNIPGELAPRGFNSIIVLFFIVPFFMLAMIFLFAFVGRQFMKKTIATSYTYAVIDTPEDLIRVSIRDGRLAEPVKRYPKISIRRFHYQETPITRFSGRTQFNTSWTADIYAQILVEYEGGEGIPKVELLAQTPKYHAASIYSLKSYLEQLGFSFGSHDTEIICPSCNAKAPANATYCENCGFNLTKTNTLI
ncbi:MAG: zinc ribbon domain-containing protein [Methanobacteriota archaeon]|nr:MAG: zinc ribbon domain-containing protein [Euryarchaeota archaeon]